MKKLSILLLVLVATFVSCKKAPEVNLKYVDVERDLVTVGMTTANIQCDYDYIATLKKAYLYYGEGEDEIDMASAEMRVVQKTLYVELAGLKENTTYHYYYEFVNGFNSMRSALKTFKTEASPTSLATVITAAVTEITTNSAKGGGEVTNDGGAEVTEQGICWSTTANPTISDSHVAAGTGTGAFSAVMSGLQANTTYHVRAYAINEKGTAYGLDREFTTIGGGGVPEGAIDGLFSVSPTQKVYFSQGNLQYQASTNTWRFAEHQWDFVGTQGPTIGGFPGGNVVGSDNRFISESYDGWIDLFGWGTSGYNHGAVCYQPWSVSQNTQDYLAYGDTIFNLNDETGQADWGYNMILNGGNANNQWRTLTSEEWSFVLFQRNTSSGYRFVKAKVNGVLGIALLPDNWNVSLYGLNNYDDGFASFDSNSITELEWSDQFEANGAVFLPAAGWRWGTGVCYVSSMDSNSDLHYWSSSHGMGDMVLSVNCNDNGCEVSIQNPAAGIAVRLAHDTDAIMPPAGNLPTVITAEVSEITANSAKGGGEIINDGGSEVTEFGICWSRNVNPTLTDYFIAVGTGVGGFDAIMNNLEVHTKYFVRAYAINSAGTAYGLNKEFITLSSGGSGAPEGAINGLFSVSPTKNVFFSQGNLQYQASTNTWKFADNQWDYVGSQNPFIGNAEGTVEGSDNSNISSTYEGWIDLFGWGTSGIDHGALCYQPWSTSENYLNYYAAGFEYNLYDQNGIAEWGTNRISNGGNVEYLWRTLTKEEWYYLINTRQTNSGARFVKAIVNDVKGMILFPDTWELSIFSFSHINNKTCEFNNNIISKEQWQNILQSHGAVFLPEAGGRIGNRVMLDAGDYWSSSCSSYDGAYFLFFYTGGVDPYNLTWRYAGRAVRLVQDTNLKIQAK